MKILIVYATAGAGNRRASEAIYSYLKKDESLDVVKIDALDYSNALFKLLYSEGYLFLVTHLSFIWVFLFYLPGNKFTSFLANSLRFFVNRINLYRLASYILKENPDCLLSTHFLPNEVGTFLKVFFKAKFKLVSIVTDFTVHPFWVARGVDKYIVASKNTQDEIVSLGVDKEKTKVIGIPIDERFYSKSDRKILSNNLEIADNLFTALIVTGAIGIGPIEEIVKTLTQENIQTIVVCGSNKKLYSNLVNLNIKTAKILGFVNNIHELMDVSDCIITKPGGLSVSEAIIKNLPMIFISPIPGQETANANLMSRLGVGFSIDSPEDILKKIVELRNDPAKIEYIRNKLKSISNTSTLKEIADEIRRSCSSPTS